MGSCLAERLGDLTDLTEAERTALDLLERRERVVRRGAALLRENDQVSELFVLKKGRMMNYVLLPDGSRQILRVLFPGDMLNVSGLMYRRSPETLVALADSVVCPFERGALAVLIERHPRLSAIIMVANQIERMALTDRLAAFGRTSAKARVAALLLEIRNRMRTTDKSITASFAPGLTQEEIGDATGLTAVHVNRMLRQLEEERLITRAAGVVTFVSEAGLARAANYVDRFVGLDLGWLPAPR